MSDVFLFDVGDGAYIVDSLSPASVGWNSVTILAREKRGDKYFYLVKYNTIKCLDTWINEDSVRPVPDDNPRNEINDIRFRRTIAKYAENIEKRNIQDLQNKDSVY